MVLQRVNVFEPVNLCRRSGPFCTSACSSGRHQAQLDVRFVPEADIPNGAAPNRVLIVSRCDAGASARKSAVDFSKYDVKGAKYGGDISEHVSTRQEIHCRQMGK
jgi:hypothetical protein